METEQKFEDGLLAKLSKITDLMSRLENYEGIAEGDKKRVKQPASQCGLLTCCIIYAMQNVR